MYTIPQTELLELSSSATPTETIYVLGIVEAETEEYDVEETNRELLAHLGETSVEEWYKQNGLGTTERISTSERMAGLVARWDFLAGEVDIEDVTSDTQLT
ncbi:MAG TPA: hypothetical protein VJ843_02410 [Candidatus Saccharimonadales bacterium]|nr:hypothetical protein [Candidatus Saccharimonadales bacterium]